MVHKSVARAKHSYTIIWQLIFGFKLDSAPVFCSNRSDCLKHNTTTHLSFGIMLVKHRDRREDDHIKSGVQALIINMIVHLKGILRLKNYVSLKFVEYPSEATLPVCLLWGCSLTKRALHHYGQTRIQPLRFDTKGFWWIHLFGTKIKLFFIKIV